MNGEGMNDEDNIIQFPTDRAQLNDAIKGRIARNLPDISEENRADLLAQLQVHISAVFQQSSGHSVNLPIAEKDKAEVVESLERLKGDLRKDIFDKIIVPLFKAVIDSEIERHRLASRPATDPNSTLKRLWGAVSGLADGITGIQERLDNAIVTIAPLQAREFTSEGVELFNVIMNRARRRPVTDQEAREIADQICRLYWTMRGQNPYEA